MASNVATLTAKLRADTTQLEAGLSRGSRQVEKFQARSTKQFANLGKKARLALVGVGVAAGAMATKSVMAFAEFEKGMNEVFTLLPEASDAALGAMTDDVKEFSKEMGVATTEVVPSLYQAISAGVPQDNVFEFMETATKASIGGVTTLETAVDGLTSVVNAYGVENITAAEASDLMFTAVRLGKTTMEELSRFLFQVNPVAAALGVNFEDVTAALAAMTAQGTPTRVASTQLRQALVELGKQGSVAFDHFKDATGQTFPEFIAKGGNVEGALQAMKTKADEMGVGVGDLFASVEAAMGVISLTSESGAAAFNRNLGEMQDAAGATETAFETMDQGLSRTWDRIKATISTALIDAGEKMAPFVEQFATWFSETLPSAIDTFSAGVEEGIDVLRSFGEGIGAVYRWFKDLPDGMEEVIVKIGLIGTALAVLWGNPVMIGLAAVAAAVTLIGESARIAAAQVQLLQDVASGDIDIDWEKAVGGQQLDALTDLGTTLDDITDAVYGSDEAFDEWQSTIRNAPRFSTLADEGLRAVQNLRWGVQTAHQDIRNEYIETQQHQEDMRDKWRRNLQAMADYTEFSAGMRNWRATVIDETSEVADALDMTQDDFEKWESEITGTMTLLEQNTARQIGQMEDDWQGLPDAIDLSVQEMVNNIIAVRDAEERWASAIQTLKERGMVELAAMFEGMGIAGAEQAESAVENWNDSVEQTLDLGGILYADISNMYGLDAAELMDKTAQKAARDFEAGWNPHLTVPTPLVRGIDGAVTGFAKGGIVTEPTLAMIGEAGYPEAVVPLAGPHAGLVNMGGVTQAGAGLSSTQRLDLGGLRMANRGDMSDAVAEALLDLQRRGVIQGIFV